MFGHVAIREPPAEVVGIRITTRRQELGPRFHAELGLLSVLEFCMVYLYVLPYVLPHAGRRFGYSELLRNVYKHAKCLFVWAFPIHSAVLLISSGISRTLRRTKQLLQMNDGKKSEAMVLILKKKKKKWDATLS